MLALNFSNREVLEQMLTWCCCSSFSYTNNIKQGVGHYIGHSLKGHRTRIAAIYKALAIAIRTIAIAIAIEAKKAIEYCNMQ